MDEPPPLYEGVSSDRRSKKKSFILSVHTPLVKWKVKGRRSSGSPSVAALLAKLNEAEAGRARAHLGEQTAISQLYEVKEELTSSEKVRSTPRVPLDCEVEWVVTARPRAVGGVLTFARSTCTGGRPG